MVVRPKAFWESYILARLRKQYEVKAKTGEMVVTRFSPTVTVRLHPRGEIAKLVYTSSFEKDLIGEVIAFLRPGMLVVDVGANCGLYSLIASQCLGKTGEVWAFEPASDMVQLFRANQRANRTKIVKLFAMALGDKVNQTVMLLCEPGQGDGYRYVDFGSTEQKKVVVAIEKVPESTLDSVWRKNGKPQIDFIKIDVEGGELRVLKGATVVLKQHDNLVILMENSAFGLARVGDDQIKLYTFMMSLGYGFYAWNQKKSQWDDDQTFVSRVGNVWVTKKPALLPKVGMS